MTDKTLPRYRTGRNWVVLGDLVKCTPRVGTSFLGEVTRIDADDEGNPTSVHVTTRMKMNGERHRHAGVSRAFTTDRLARVSRTRGNKLLSD
jgi:hypothetical protein